jgi:hypothetical protein
LAQTLKALKVSLFWPLHFHFAPGFGFLEWKTKQTPQMVELLTHSLLPLFLALQRPVQRYYFH